MSLFISLASGFLEGQVEKQRDEALAIQQENEVTAERLKTGRGKVADLISSGKGTQEAVNALVGMYGLDPVGFANVANMLGSADTTISFGGDAFSIPKPEKWDDNIKASDLAVSGSTWMRTMNEVAQNPELWDKLSQELQNNMSVRKNFDNELNRYADYYTMGMQKKNTNPATGVVSAYLKPSVAYAPLYEKLRLLKLDAPDNSDKVTINNNPDIENPANAVVFKFRDTEGVEQLESREFNEGTYKSLGAIALNLGYRGNKNTSPVQQLVDKFADVSRADNADEAFQTLLAAAELEKMGASSFNRTGGANTQLASSVGDKLVEKFGSDRVLMAQAMAPLMSLEEDQFNKNSRLSYSMQPAATYFKKYLDVDVAQIREQHSETQETLRLLNELKAKVGKQTTPTGFVASLKSVFGGAFGEGGQLQQLLGTNTDNASSEQVLQRAKTLGFISTAVIQDLSEIEAMKLTLAAKMARAIDPSGRLSNQDFEVQLQRLGQTGLFTGKVEAASKLNIVIEDFTNRGNRMTLLNELANAPEFNAREARLLKASMAIQRSMDARRSGIYATQSGQINQDVITPDSRTEQKRLVIDPDVNFYTDGSGNYFKDEQGTQPVSPEEFMNALNGV